MATISVQLFAAAAQLTGTKQVELSFSGGQSPTVSDIVQQLLLEYPQLQSLARRSRWAINDDFVELSQVIRAEDRIAMIPPVSGG